MAVLWALRWVPQAKAENATLNWRALAELPSAIEVVPAREQVPSPTSSCPVVPPSTGGQLERSPETVGTSAQHHRQG